MAFTAIVIYYLLAFGFLIATCYHKSLTKFHPLGKLLSSIGFVLVATYGGFVTGQWALYFYMLPGFLLCLCGDVLLGLEEGTGREKLFLAGLSSFLLGHIAFILAFCMRTELTFKDFILPILVVAVALILVRMKGFNVGKMRGAVLLYSFFVALLFSKAISLVVMSEGAPADVLLCVGSFFFLLSDVIILFLRFYVKQHHLVRFFNLLTYYLGMFLIGLSLLY